jgi:hypothetical protein
VCAQDPFCCNNQWDSICANEAIQKCAVCQQGACNPDCNKQNVECLNPGFPARYANRTIVAQLRFGPPPGTPYCTAWIIAAPDCMLTNNHCAPAVGEQAVFNFECTLCVGGVCKATQTFNIVQVVACNAAQDWCIFRVNGNVAGMFGQAKIDPNPPVIGESIYEIHHAGGLKKGYDDGQVTAFPVNTCVNNEMAVNVIASGGASGSPLFRQSNDCVFGYCNCGPTCLPGSGVPLSVSWPNIQAAIPPSCTVMMCSQGGSNCCVAHPTPGCDNAACQSAVCSQDPFCCNNQWDSICANEAIAKCAVCGASTCPPNNNNCGLPSPDGTPGCNVPACCDAVCAQDSFCCDTAWDGICANEALSKCALPCPGQGGDCCAANGTPGCDDVQCCKDVCAQDSFCCNTAWDGICANAAIAKCPACQQGCPPNNNNCGLPSPDGTPGCNVPACCDAVCAQDSFCCNTAWDGICANEALSKCALPCPGQGGDCCVADGTPGCDDVQCCKDVCAQDPFCCNNSWDSICANEAISKCPGCDVGGPPNDECRDRIPIGNGTTTFSNIGATTDGPSPCGALGSDIWYNYTANFTGTLVVDTFGSPFDTVLAAYDGCECDQGSANVCDTPGVCGTYVECGTGTPFNCICWTTDQGALCFQDFFCAGLTPCVGGDCPPGFACVFDSCCGVDVCVEIIKCDVGAAQKGQTPKGSGKTGSGAYISAEGGVSGGPTGNLLACNDDTNGLQSQISFPVVAGNCYKIQLGGFNGAQGNGVINITKQPDEGCPPNDNNCALPSPNGTPGCVDPDCCDAVCAQDPFCCDVSWDSLCANTAIAKCALPCPGQGGDCCVANGTPGCDDVQCCKDVCAQDSFCCTTAWDSICANEALAKCECVVPTCPGEGNCFQANGTPGCEDLECCEAVCAQDPFCCDVAWDSICAAEAQEKCGNDACPSPGNCFLPHGGQGCKVAACCKKVCLQDPFCCDVAWDGICANEALAKCPPDLCKADIIPNGNVDVVDLVELVLNWNCQGICIGDVNKDGATNVVDLVQLILAWGPCP